ncbi:MAG: aspartate aminotransferase family protein [Myxococcaceae bacterium]|nr:aspartate aminotransferase family protein [Myxococcaceae bacterium]MCA3011532.1 aspartate aminotransferase family protein [Myxococcaceae bacterium]
MIEAKGSSATVSSAAPSRTERAVDSAKHHLLQNYKQQPVVLVRGEGAWVWDAEGRRYLDLIQGIATCALGHCHPAVVAAARAQLETLWHVSNVFYTEPQLQLAERLTAAFGGRDARAFFCNSGAEANEALIKLARRYQHEVAGQRERSDIITFEGSFHGRTLATVTATAQPKYQAGFEPLPQGFRYAPMGDLEAVKRLVGPTTAAILIEPIQGEGGVRPAPPGFLSALRALCDEHGLLLLIDEVQTGIGRTGTAFAYQQHGVQPDAISLAKSLGNGLPIGAMVCSDAVGKALPSGTHGSTFGGNPVAAAAAVATWDLATTPEALKANAEKGELLHRLGRELQARRPGRVVDVRGRGLLFGIEVDGGAADVVARCRQNGLLVNLAGEKTVRFAPAFVTSAAELAEGVAMFERSL